MLFRSFPSHDIEDDFVEPVEGGAAEAVLLGRSGEGSGGRVGGDAENDIILGIDILFEGEPAALGVDDEVVHVEIAAPGFFVGVQFSPGQAEIFAHPVVEALIKNVVGVFLDGEGGVFEKGEVLHLRGVVEVNQDAGTLPLLGLEDGLKKAS